MPKKCKVRFSSVVSDKEWPKSSIRLVSDNAQIRWITSTEEKISKKCFNQTHFFKTCCVSLKSSKTDPIFISILACGCVTSLC